MTIDDIKPGMSAEDRAAARAEINQILGAMNAAPALDALDSYAGEKLPPADTPEGQRAREAVVNHILGKQPSELTDEDRAILRNSLRRVLGLSRAAGWRLVAHS